MITELQSCLLDLLADFVELLSVPLPVIERQSLQDRKKNAIWPAAGSGLKREGSATQGTVTTMYSCPSCFAASMLWSSLVIGPAALVPSRVFQSEVVESLLQLWQRHLTDGESSTV